LPVIRVTWTPDGLADPESLTTQSASLTAEPDATS
jgi:hypothetical protein